MGTDMVELDVQLTRDGEVVVSHDNHLVRTTGQDVKISETPYASLPLLKPEITVDFEPGTVCRAAETADRSIPKLSDVFRRFPQLPINIDIKTDNDVLVRQVASLIKENEREDYTVWGNVSDKIRKKCYKENPEIPTFFSSLSVLKLVLLTYSGLLPFFPIRERCLEIFYPAMFLRKIRENPQQFPIGRAFRIALWLTDKLLMRKAIFEHLRKRGIQTYLWVLNTEEDYEKAFKLGATGVMTDYPTKLADFLRRNSQYDTKNQQI